MIITTHNAHSSLRNADEFPRLARNTVIDVDTVARGRISGRVIISLPHFLSIEGHATLMVDDVREITIPEGSEL